MIDGDIRWPAVMTTTGGGMRISDQIDSSRLSINRQTNIISILTRYNTLMFYTTTASTDTIYN